MLVTDEDADDASSYAYDGQTGYAGLASDLDATGYLNDIITSTFPFDTFAPIQRPEATSDAPYPALFDLANFPGPPADPAAFFRAFANVKAQEISVTGPITNTDNDGVNDNENPGTGNGGENPSMSPVPLPASAWLLVAALGGLGLARRRRA